MLKYCLVLGAVLLWGCARLAQQPRAVPERERVIALLAEIDSRAKVGLSFNDFQNLLTEIRIAIDTYSRSGNALPENRAKLESAFDGLVIAKHYWRCSINYDLPKPLNSCQKRIVQIFLNSNPNEKIRAYYDANDFSRRFDPNNEMLFLLIGENTKVIEQLSQSNS